MKTKLLLGLTACVLWVLTACNPSLPEGDKGFIGLVPFFDEGQGMQGVLPPQGWTDQAELIRESLPGTREDLVALVLDRTSLTGLPAPRGTYQGKALTWDLYTFEAQIQDAGPQTFRVDLALAEGDAAAHLVALISPPGAHEANAALYDTVFTHVLYALAPL